MRVFVGYDPRQPVAYNVLQHSIHRHAKERVSVEPLILGKLPIKRRGLTEFTFTRYLVPYLCGYEGSAVFMDADIAVTGDIGTLFAQADGVSAVQVNKSQDKFEWPSVMLFNNAHCKALTPEWVEDPANKPNALGWGSVGEFSADWNHCVNKVSPAEAKLYHYTEGVPLWDEVRGSPLDGVWMDEYTAATHSVPWRELMGGSVHAEPVIRRYMKRKFGIELAPRG